MSFSHPTQRLNRILLDQLDNLGRRAQHRDMIRVQMLHRKLRTRLINPRLRQLRRNRPVLTSNHVHNLEVAHVRNIRCRRIESIEGRELQFRGPIVSLARRQQVVKSLLGRVLNQISVCRHGAIVVVEVEDRR